MSAPLCLPPAPFNLARALAAARLVGEAYVLTDQWQEQRRPSPAEFEWRRPESLAGYEIGAPLWADTRKYALFERPQPFGFVARAGAVAYVALRGTENPADFVTNAKLRLVDYAIPNCEGFGAVHDGFLELYTALREALLEQLRVLEGIETLVVAGHSMGAAISTLAIPDLARNAGLELGRQRLIHYSFGSPRVGDPRFAASLDGLAGAHGWANAMSYRLVNSADLIPLLPPATVERVVGDDERYQHAGTTVAFSQNYGPKLVNHHLKGVYIYALEHADDPHNADWVRN